MPAASAAMTPPPKLEGVGDAEEQSGTYSVMWTTRTGCGATDWLAQGDSALRPATKPSRPSRATKRAPAYARCWVVRARPGAGESGKRPAGGGAGHPDQLKGR